MSFICLHLFFQWKMQESALNIIIKKKTMMFPLLTSFTLLVKYMMTLLRKPKIWTFNTQTRIDCSSKRGCYSEMIAYSYSQYTNKDNHLWFNFEIFWEEICHLRTHLCLRHQNEEQIFGLWHGLVFIHTGSEANNLIHAKWACLSNCPF